MNLSSSTLLALALKRLIIYLVSLEVPPIVSIEFTVRRDNDFVRGFLIQIKYLLAEPVQDPNSDLSKKDVKKPKFSLGSGV